jgi:hypothetical protein
MILKLRKDHDTIIALYSGTIISKWFNTEINEEITALAPKNNDEYSSFTLIINIYI